MKEGEVWKDIPGYEGEYQVSNLGRVKKLPREQHYGVGKKKIMPEKILPPKISRPKGGHSNMLFVLLFKGGTGVRHQVKRLVASAFLGAKPEYVIDHKDGQYENCQASNLEVMTRQKRRERSLELPAGVTEITGININSGATVTFRSVAEANVFCGVTLSDKEIVRACLGLKQKAHGYYWTYC